MHPYKRKRRTRRDMVVLGGWLFADLLLGLAMLFAVANTVGQAPPTPTPTATPNQLQTAQANLNAQQAENQETVEALENQIALADTSAEQTQEAIEQQSAAATRAADAEATRAALSESDRATADALATEEAFSAQATIAALATEQAGADSSVTELNNQLATNVAQATDVAAQINTQATEQAALQAQATENAASGANAQATAAAAQNQVVTNATQVSAIQSTADAAQNRAATVQAQSSSAQATIDAQAISAQAASDAASAELANANATAAALQTQLQQNSLNPQSVTQTIQVDLGGVVNNDPGAVEDARVELRRIFNEYVNGQNCKIGFVIISSRAPDVGPGVALSRAMAEIIQSEFPQLLPERTDGSAPELASNPISYPGTEPSGEVELQLFLSTGCVPASG